MKIAIIGAGFTGLAAGLKLSRFHHQIIIFEKNNSLGGLAETFQLPSWQWAVEKHYHHWFTNDKFALNLIKELGLADNLVFSKTETSLFLHDRIYPFNTPGDVLNFTPLTFAERLLTGFITAYLKFLPVNQAIKLEKTTAWEWLKKHYGEKTFQTIWQPLLVGKFGKFARQVNMAWFWARIKKRTRLLGYLKGGYGPLLRAIQKEIEKNGGEIRLNSSYAPTLLNKFDKIIFTTPSAVFADMFKFPREYSLKLKSIPHLYALNLLLITKEKILPSTYWLNINTPGFPFIGVIQHTNLMNPKFYGGNHLAWVANYLPYDHPYLQMSKEEVFNIYLPYLQKINPYFNLTLNALRLELFTGPFAQPVFKTNYSRQKPDFITPVKNVYLANMDMVYPWDRGTNYAIELGVKIANLIDQKSV